MKYPPIYDPDEFFSELQFSLCNNVFLFSLDYEHSACVPSDPKGQFEWCSSKERELKVFSIPEVEVLFNNSHWWYLCVLTQSCLTLCDPMDCSPPDSSVHGIFQAKMLEWVAISFSSWYVWLVVLGDKETTVSSLETVSSRSQWETMVFLLQCDVQILALHAKAF